MSTALAAVLVLVVGGAPADVPAASPAPSAPASQGDTGTTSAQTGAAPADGIVAAVADLMARAKEAGRVAVLPVDDKDAARAVVLERAIVAALRERRREEVVTPASVKAALQGAATAMQEGAPVALPGLAADHVLSSAVIDEGGEAVLRMRLVLVETGEVLGQAAVPAGGASQATTAAAATVRGAIARLVDDIAFGVEETQRDARYLTFAVAPLAAQGDAAKESRLDRYLQAALLAGLKERGYLVVERERIAAAIDQMALGAALGEEGAPEVGRLTGADIVVVGAISEAGEQFIVNARAVSTGTAQVVAAGGASIVRDNVVVVANDAVETKTAGESVFRSLVAPGWGQAYNGEGVKSALFAIGGYGGVATTLGLGVAGLVTWRMYTDYDGTTAPGVTTTPSDQAVALRSTTNVLFAATGIAALVTTAIWAGGALDAYVVGSENER